MESRLEGENRPELEQRVDQLENTVRALARETGSITLHGPCQSCGQCLVFLRNGQMYCPHCGGGQNF